MQFAEDFLTSKKEILNIIPQSDRDLQEFQGIRIQNVRRKLKYYNDGTVKDR